MKAALSTKDSNRRLRSHRSADQRKRSDALSRIHPSSLNRAVIKHILACVDGTDMDSAVLHYARQAAVHFCSHIDVLHVHFDVHGVTLENRTGDLFDRLLADPVEGASIEASNRARHHFKSWRAETGIPLNDIGPVVQGSSAQWREIIGYESDVIARLGRLSDLIIAARSGGRSSSSSAMILETALFETGRPVLMVSGDKSFNLFHRPFIAWNGSREAARAVGFALPFLSEFDGCIEVFAAPEGKHHTHTAELLRYLSWHGIVAERSSSDEATGMNLLAQASANQTGLIVMGAYTHGHYRQFLFGGMTRHVMEHSNIPILFAH